MQRIPRNPIKKDRIYYSTLQSPFGLIGIAASPKGICNIRTALKSEKDFLRYLNKVYDGPLEHNRGQLKEVTDQLKAYFQGKLTRFTCKLDLDGTEFQKNVWTQLRKIPYRTTRSYQWLAERVANPKACRAVGNANGRNPVPIIIPCHRVIAADGGLGGYTGGLSLKQTLLNLEQSGHASL